MVGVRGKEMEVRILLDSIYLGVRSWKDNSSALLRMSSRWLEL